MTETILLDNTQGGLDLHTKCTKIPRYLVLLIQIQPTILTWTTDTSVQGHNSRLVVVQRLTNPSENGSFYEIQRVQMRGI